MAVLKFSRREVLKGTVAASSFAPLTRLSGVAPAARPLRLGAPVLVESDDPAILAETHRQQGYRAAYAPEVSLTDSDRIESIRREFTERDVVIAEVGAWVNMLDPNPEKRRENVDYVMDRLALAEELGALCCVDIAGSFNPDNWMGPHPENFSKDFFEATVETVRKVVDWVKPTRTRFAIEMMGWMLPSSPDEYLALLKAVDRPSLAVHVDVCNLINSPERMYRNSDVINECFDKLGLSIVSCHAKDVAWVPERQMHFLEVMPGRGEIDYATYLRRISSLSREVPLMIEHLETAEEYAEAAGYIRGVASGLGLGFG